LADLGSSNGTFLNGQRVTGRHSLAMGDQISLGRDGPKLKVI
jgi:pSer/pThr/pTyr-binding forkhead associated (FHA) protein